MMRTKMTIAGSVTLCAFACTVAAPRPAAAQKAPLTNGISTGADGHLVYESDARGNRIPDFSFAGYAGGDHPIPDVPVRVTVSAPTKGEDAGARIQAALDYAARLPVDANGIRGTVLLGKGRFPVAGRLVLRASGVVLRGQGKGTDGTVLVATGISRRTLIEVRGAAEGSSHSDSSSHNVTAEYVPVGTRDLDLDNVEGLKAGDTIRIERPSPPQWLQAVGMAAVPGRPAPGWVANQMNVVWDREITSVNGNRVTLDAPLTCALEKTFGGARVTASSWLGRLHQVGVENLRCESEWDHTNPRDEEHAWMAVTLSGVEDAWVRGVTGTHFVSSVVQIDQTCRRVTVEDCASLAPVSELGGYRRHSFYSNGQQTLFLRCRAEDGRHDFALGWLAAGPNAFVQCEAQNAHDFSGPIESWATGALYDNIVMDGGGLRVDNRELWDNGVGWAGANCVLWQCSVPIITARTPPGAQNWVIGCWGQFVGDARFRTPNEFVKPDSLYVAQLGDRIGAATAKVVLAPFTPAETAGAPTLEAVLPHAGVMARTAAKQLPLRTENGLLTVGGKPLIGDQVNIAWWRGQAQPGRAEEFGPSITRWVPGRIGLGETDDLNALTDRMHATNQAYLRHHWGLWYDRRREDHEMIRRVDANVWPPFYEQPWARSGVGIGWNGLSRYDLSKYNPWYFSRLHEFASLCTQKGLMLVNAMYFQHNILEAGAHWADFPWRTANNINNPGFPEPPPYVGKKRIFMADAFYNVSQPARRKLHEAFIRHCLSNLADQPNVIHVLGEEYSGPLSFMRFWLDTVAQWRKDNPGKHVLIGLSAPRDVQDAILADPKRSVQVDVIDFKYWWDAGKTEFAPKGGQNLAPRQHEREWHGKRADDIDLAHMASTYRTRFPNKVVMCDFPEARWAYLCAGGSIPNLPATTDPALLAALPHMRPWKIAIGSDCWALRAPGSACLVYMSAATANAPETLDLSSEHGEWSVRTIDPATGGISSGAISLTAGKSVTLPETGKGHPVLFWLTRGAPRATPATEVRLTSATANPPETAITASDAKEARDDKATLDDKEAAYTRMLTDRVAKIVTPLGITDTAKASRVQAIIDKQYRALRDLPDSASADAERARLHGEFLKALAVELTPAQIDTVKDGMTYGVLPLTYRVYQEMLPDMTAPQKAQILAWLTEAREHAMDAGTAKAKHGWFTRYKGKITNYLSAAGYDLKKAEKALMDRQKAAKKTNNDNKEKETP